MDDPRNDHRYTKLRKAWLPTQAGLRCWMCDQPVDVNLSGRSRYGPSVEHTLPVREILKVAATWDDAVALACDISLWRLCHIKCNSRQGALVSNVTRHGRRERRPSREW